MNAYKTTVMWHRALVWSRTSECTIQAKRDRTKVIGCFAQSLMLQQIMLYANSFFPPSCLFVDKSCNDMEKVTDFHSVSVGSPSRTPCSGRTII